MSTTKYLTSQGLTSLWSKIVKNLGILKDYLVDKITEETTARQAEDVKLKGLIDNKVSDVQVNGVSAVTSGKANIDLSSYAKSSSLDNYATKTSLNDYAKLTDGKLSLDVIPDGISSSVDLTDYLKTADADSKYLSLNGGTVNGDIEASTITSTLRIKASTISIKSIITNNNGKYLSVANSLDNDANKVFSTNGGIVDLSNYAKTTDLDSYAKTSDLSSYVSSSDLSKYLPLSGGTMTGALYLENYNIKPLIRIPYTKSNARYYYSELNYKGIFVRIPLNSSTNSYIESEYTANDMTSLDGTNSYNAKIEKCSYSDSGTYNNTCGTYIGSDNIIIGLQNNSANTFYRNAKLTYNGLYFYKANQTNTSTLDSLLTFSYNELSIDTKLYIKSSFVTSGYSNMYKMTLGNIYLSDLKTTEVLAGKGTKIDISQYAKKTDLSGYLTSADMDGYIKAEDDKLIRLNNYIWYNNGKLRLYAGGLDADQDNENTNNSQTIIDAGAVTVSGENGNIKAKNDLDESITITGNKIEGNYFCLVYTQYNDFRYNQFPNYINSELYLGSIIVNTRSATDILCGQGAYIDSTTLAKVTDLDSYAKKTDLSNYATTSSLSNYIAKNNIKTINGNSLVGTGNISIDLSIYTIVDSLPTTNINKNKIYLVANSSSGDTANKYVEYIYTGDTAKDYNAANWEKLGEYKANVDLTPYLKSTDAANTYLTKTAASSTYQAKGNYAAASHTHNYASSVVVGTTTYNVSSNKITIPAYPTTLPASDVKAWAKADSKPSYAWSEITGKPSSFTPTSHTHSAADITSGTLEVARGGTGRTTLKDAGNAIINSLDTASTTPVDADYYISQYAGGGTTNTTFHRRPMSALYSYVKSKLDSVYQPKGTYLTSHQDISGKANKATTLAGYGITDAKIANGVITLGNNTITPLTSHQSLADYAKTVTTTGTGNAVTAITKSGNTITVTKGSNFLTSHQSLANYYNKTEVDNKIKAIDLSGYLPLNLDNDINITFSSYHDIILKTTNRLSYVKFNSGSFRAYYYDANPYNYVSKALIYGNQIISNTFDNENYVDESTDLSHLKSSCRIYSEKKNGVFVAGSYCKDYDSNAKVFMQVNSNSKNDKNIYTGFIIEGAETKLDGYTYHEGFKIQGKTNKDLPTANFGTVHIGSDSDTTSYTKVAPLDSNNKIPSNYIDTSAFSVPRFANSIPTGFEDIIQYVGGATPDCPKEDHAMGWGMPTNNFDSWTIKTYLVKAIGWFYSHPTNTENDTVYRVMQTTYNNVRYIFIKMISINYKVPDTSMFSASSKVFNYSAITNYYAMLGAINTTTALYGSLASSNYPAYVKAYLGIVNSNGTLTDITSFTDENKALPVEGILGFTTFRQIMYRLNCNV